MGFGVRKCGFAGGWSWNGQLFHVEQFEKLVKTGVLDVFWTVRSAVFDVIFTVGAMLFTVKISPSRWHGQWQPRRTANQASERMREPIMPTTRTGVRLVEGVAVEWLWRWGASGS